MEPIRQGEKLMLLVKRDNRTTEEIARAMNVDKSYLPRLYKMDKLPRKPLRKAIAVFHVTESYFTENGETPSVVREADAPYLTAFAQAKAELVRLEEENAALREEIAQIKSMLAQEKNISANLSEALVNLSKRN